MSRDGTWISALGYRNIGIIIVCFFLFSPSHSSSFLTLHKREGVKKEEKKKERESVLCAGSCSKYLQQKEELDQGQGKEAWTRDSIQEFFVMEPVKPSPWLPTFCTGRKLSWSKGTGITHGYSVTEAGILTVRTNSHHQAATHTRVESLYFRIRDAIWWNNWKRLSQGVLQRLAFSYLGRRQAWLFCMWSPGPTHCAAVSMNAWNLEMNERDGKDDAAG